MYMSISTIIFSNSCVTFVAGAQNKRNARVVKAKKKKKTKQKLYLASQVHILSLSLTYKEIREIGWYIYVEKNVCVYTEKYC